jgi:nucleotide-binding universal stress UspA family protein
VIVSLSGAEAPLEAIEAGREIARALRAPLHGVCVWPTPITPCEVARLLRIDPAALSGMVLDVDVGDPIERLHVALRSQPSSFVVLVAERDGRDPSGLGELSARALARTKASAVVLRPGAPLGRVRRILVPIDGTPSMAAALCPAGELARALGAALDVVMITDAGAPPPEEPGAMQPPRYVDQPQHEWPAFSTEIRQRLLCAIARWPTTPKPRLLLGSGPPAAEILRFARALDPDLIALVWDDETAGVLREVARGTDRPLLVLRRCPAS